MYSDVQIAKATWFKRLLMLIDIYSGGNRALVFAAFAAVPASALWWFGMATLWGAVAIPMIVLLLVHNSMVMSRARQLFNELVKEKERADRYNMQWRALKRKYEPEPEQTLEELLGLERKDDRPTS